MLDSSSDPRTSSQRLQRRREAKSVEPNRPRRGHDVPSGGKFVPEHGPPALRSLSRRLVLDDVPMLGEQAVFDTQDVDHDPVHWLPDP